MNDREKNLQQNERVVSHPSNFVPFRYGKKD